MDNMYRKRVNVALSEFQDIIREVANRYCKGDQDRWQKLVQPFEIKLRDLSRDLQNDIDKAIEEGFSKTNHTQK
jgi:hypothetical protein